MEDIDRELDTLSGRWQTELAVYIRLLEDRLEELHSLNMFGQSDHTIMIKGVGPEKIPEEDEGRSESEVRGPGGDDRDTRATRGDGKCPHVLRQPQDRQAVRVLHATGISAEIRRDRPKPPPRYLLPDILRDHRR